MNEREEERWCGNERKAKNRITVIEDSWNTDIDFWGSDIQIEVLRPYQRQ
jgi:hypothetical protein